MVGRASQTCCQFGWGAERGANDDPVAFGLGRWEKEQSCPLLWLGGLSGSLLGKMTPLCPAPALVYESIRLQRPAPRFCLQEGWAARCSSTRPKAAVHHQAWPGLLQLSGIPGLPLAAVPQMPPAVTCLVGCLTFCPAPNLQGITACKLHFNPVLRMAGGTT